MVSPRGMVGTMKTPKIKAAKLHQGFPLIFQGTVLGGSWVVISGVRSRVAIVKTHIIRGLITPLITAHEPPSRACGSFKGPSLRVPFRDPAIPQSGREINSEVPVPKLFRILKGG